MRWDDLKVVLAVARCETLSAAAARLGVDQTTVSRRLAALERSLGVRLFTRSNGRLLPSQSGEALCGHAERVEAELAGLEQSLGSGSAPQGSVRLTSVPILFNRLLIPRLGPLLERHPGLTLEIVNSWRDLNLSKREADVAVRFNRPSGGHALCRRLAALGWSPYCAVGRDAAALPWLGYGEDCAHLPQARWIAANGAAAAPLLGDDAEPLYAAVTAGLGKSVLPDFAAAADPRLRRLSEAPVLEREVWLLVHPDLRHLPRVGAVVDWLLETFAGLDRVTPPPRPTPARSPRRASR